MSFLRRASLSKKTSSGDLSSSPNRHGATDKGERPTRPPTSRSVSAANSIASFVSDKERKGSDHKRKNTLGGKTKRRLSSLFSSNSLSSHLNDDREGSASPRRGSSVLHPSTSTSGSSSPAHPLSPGVSRYAGLGAHHGTARDAALADSLNRLELGTPVNGKSSVTESPQGLSPVSPLQMRNDTVPQPGGVASTARALSSSSSRIGADKKLPRPPSMYSVWDLDDAESSSDEDDEAFMTPPEGLSEVEEGDEDDDEAGAFGRPKAVVAAAPVLATTRTTTKKRGDGPPGGEPSIRRHTITAPPTKVKKRDITPANALSVDQAAVLGKDLDSCREILSLFLRSQMRAAEERCEALDPHGNRLYLQSAHGIIQSLKGMMTFDEHDLTSALDICKGTTVTASALRKPTEGLLGRMGGLVRPGAGLARVRTMTPLERHAELVYAETSLMKAILAIVSGGDWMGMIREALNMRTAHGIYRTLQQFLEESDRDGYDDEIDMDFRSGVLLGTGTSSLMLSLLPSKVLKIAEVFGFAGDRSVALKTLMEVGGWTQESDLPLHGDEVEGVRRPVVDMILLTFYLVISLLMPVTGVDIPMARKILAYNMKRYPDGIFFLYFQARLHTAQAEPEEANACLQRALDLPLEYVQLQHMCLWDYACNFMTLGNWKGALDCFNILRKESNWSRAVYTYATAVTMLEMVEDGHPDADLDFADGLMKEIPKLTKKIAGKSLPIEKFVSRKARKFESQGRRLFLPALELSYVFGSWNSAPRRCLLKGHMVRIDAHLAKLADQTEDTYEGGHGYWDDYCLGHFLRGMAQFMSRYQPENAAPSAGKAMPGDPTEDELDAGAEKDFQAVLRHGPDVTLDHFIVYHCHFELGKLYAKRGDEAQARKNFEIVMSGKMAEVNHHEKKAQGKYSLEGALQLKTHAALQSLKERKP